MLETPVYPTATHEGENAAVGPISRKDLDLAWLAGIVDGEGCVSAYWWKQTNPNCRDNHGMRVSLSITNTNAAMIRRVTEILVGNGVPFNYVAGKSRNRGISERDTVTVMIMGKGRLLKALRLLVPHLTAKHRQAELAIELIEYRESLAVHGRESKGRFAGLDLRGDERINALIQQIKDEKWVKHDLLQVSRKPSSVFGGSSTTIRSPRREQLAA